MALEIFSIELVSIIAIILIIIPLVVAFLKKWMIVYGLIIANFLVFIPTLIFTTKIGDSLYSTIIIDLGFRPLYLSVDYSPQLYTLFTSMFVHGGFLHIIGNMLVFFFVGTAFEERVGAKKFLIIYLLSGICGTLFHSVLNLEGESKFITLIGASGAIFGIMGAFAYSYPRDEVAMPIPLGFIMIIRRIKVIYAVLIFAAMETVIVFIGVQDSTAHFAHLGGLIGGFILAALLIGRNKTHYESGRTVYYDSFTSPRKKDIDFDNLRKFATSPEHMEILDKIRNESVPQVREIWLEHFLEKVVCPKCGSSLKHFDGDIWCDSCGFKTKY